MTTTSFETFDHITNEMLHFLDGFEHPLAVASLAWVLAMLIKMADDPEATKKMVIDYLQRGAAEQPPTLN